MSDEPPSPDDQVLAEERRDRVRRALDRLTERERGLLLLRHEGYSYRQLAEALDLTESSVGTLLARAKAAFRAAYENQAPARDQATPAGEPDVTT